MIRLFKTGWSEGIDGPGRRWVLHTKGCSLRCRWCANPEGISSELEMLFYPERQTGAVSACSQQAVKHGDKALDRKLCQQCAKRLCVNLWRHPAFELAGEDWSVARIVAGAIERRSFMAPDGGITFSGGEPTMQITSLYEVIKRLVAEKIDVAVETNAATQGFTKLLGLPILLICDLKCIDPVRHRDWTGMDNSLILKQLEIAASTHEALLLRIPLIPGFNTEPEEQCRMSDFMANLIQKRNGLSVEVMRFHHMGAPKYAALGETDMCAELPPDTALAGEWIDNLQQKGISARLVS